MIQESKPNSKMKLLIGFALLSVAFAYPAVQPVSLPEPAQPEVVGIELTQPEFPIWETHDETPGFQRPDISPLMIPQEVIDALRMIGESPFGMSDDTVQIVEVAENFLEDDASDDSVIVVDHVQEELPVENDAVSPVNFVDVAEDVQPKVAVAQEPVDADDSVLVERISYDAEDQDDSISFNDVAENMQDMPEDVDAVIFVDHAEETVASDAEAPLESEDVPVNRVIVVDDVQTSTEDAQESEGTAVQFVDEAVPTDLESIVSEVLLVEDLNENYDAVKFVDSPVDYPPKYYDDPMLR